MQCDCDFIFETKPGWEEHYDNCSIHSKPGEKPSKNSDGILTLKNDHLLDLDQDVLYHLGLDTVNYDLPALFGDVKFVCMGGTKHRMREFAKYLSQTLGREGQDELINLTKNSQRYAMYKVGPVLSVSHGIGIPSMTILLQEVIKLLHYARARQPVIFRIGTSGGLGLQPGSVVISTFGLNGTLQKSYDLPILGKMRSFPSIFDKRLSQELQSLVSAEDSFQTVLGGTFAADDFYRGQARIDGPFCDHTAEDKNAFLLTLRELGVRNIEMEATAFSAMAREAGLRAADVCVTLLDRLNGDQVTPSKATLTEWQKRPMFVVGRYIAKYYKDRFIASYDVKT